MGEEIARKERDMHQPDRAGVVDPEIIHEPIASFGHCLNARRCRSYDVILGDGICQQCWDMNLRGLVDDATAEDQWNRITRAKRK